MTEKRPREPEIINGELIVAVSTKTLTECISNGIKQAFSFILGLIVIAIILAGIIQYFTVPKDSTDSPDSRSGMSLHTDYETGCQYLSTVYGGITPRLDAKGYQIGCRENEF